MINSGTMQEYATARTKSHLSRFLPAQQQIEDQAIDEAWLTELEAQDQHLLRGRRLRAFRRNPAGCGPGHRRRGAYLSSPLLERFRRRSATLVASAHRDGVPGDRSVCQDRRARRHGGLAGGCPRTSSGQRVSLIMPAYRGVLQGGFALRDTGIRIAVPMGGRPEEAHVLVATRRGRHPCLPDPLRSVLRPAASLQHPEGDYPDNAERFAFFARAALEVLREIDARRYSARPRLAGRPGDRVSQSPARAVSWTRLHRGRC